MKMYACHTQYERKTEPIKQANGAQAKPSKKAHTAIFDERKRKTCLLKSPKAIQSEYIDIHETLNAHSFSTLR